MRLASTVARVKRHMENAKKLEKENISDYYVFNTLAMECFQAVNASIDLGEYIVEELNLGVPTKYREIFEFIYQSKLINRKTMNTIKRLIFLRNLISHEYYIIKQAELREMARKVAELEKLIEVVKKVGK
jgi:uncharacterized protein YutE (UPF0331/DUF86 family)